MEEAVAFEGGDVNVVEAVVIEVANGDADAVHFDVESAAGGDIGEGAVLIVTVERAEGFSAARRPVLAVDEEDVAPAVTIQVDECRSRTERFRKVFLAGLPGVVDKVDARG